MSFSKLSGTTAGVLAIFAPVRALVVCAVVFVAIDFVTGVLASRKRALKAGLKWNFESEKAWSTVVKLIFVMAGIVLAWMIDSLIVPFWSLKLANLFTGFACGVEFWSYLENAAEISDHRLFRGLRKLVKQKMEDKL